LEKIACWVDKAGPMLTGASILSASMMLRMKILITLGATREPIDAVRFIGNRSSGRMGAALASAAIAGGHEVTVIAAAITVALPELAGPHRRVDVEMAREMYDAVLREFPSHRLLIMAAAVADYRPIRAESGKLPRSGSLTIECEPTEDILAAVAAGRRANQRVVGFSLEEPGNIDRSRQKLAAKKLDMMVFNPLETMGSPTIDAMILYPDGSGVELGRQGKEQTAPAILAFAERLFSRP
jgi:phosphopantothenoylcysteine decarboxylase / phosphopantothenate---cysteine ligase